MFSILYVDDEPGLLEIGKMFLEQGGRFSVETITSAAEALEILRTEHYDAIISDYQMPVMDGIEFLKRVRASGNTIPFIIFTGRGREEIVIQALNEGADFYLQKGGEPLSQFAELAHKIRQAVQQRMAEASIRDHERREADIINFLPDATFAIDQTGHVIAWNRAIEEMTGTPASEMLGKGDYAYAIPFYGERRPMLIDLIYESDEVIAEKYSYIIHEKNVLIAQTTLPRPKGKPVTLMGKASPLYNRQGEIIGAIESIRDITQMKNAEVRVRESEEQFSAFMDRLPVTAFIKDDQSTNLFVNRNMREIFGFGEWVGKSVRELFPREAAEKMIEDDRQTLREGYRKAIEPLRGKDGKLRIYETIKFRIDRENKPPLIGGFASDITERKRAEDTVRESEQKYRTVFETTGTATVLIENDGMISLANSEFARLSGYPKDEIESRKKWTEFVVKEDLDRMLAQHQMRRQDPASALSHYEFRFRTRSGEIRDIYLTIDVIPGTTKSVASLLDITERKQAENAIRESEQRYRNVVEDQTEFISRFLPDGTHVFVNEAYCRYFGLKRDEILGHRFRPQIPAEDQEKVRSFFASLTPEHTVDIIVHRIIMPDGAIRWQRWSDRAIFDPDGKLREYQSVGRDITETKEAEFALQASEERYRLIADNTADHIWIFDMDLNLKYTSPSVMKMKGFTVEEVLSQSLEEMMTPASVESVLRRFQEEMALEAGGTADPGRTITFETEEYIRNGSTIMVENMVTLMRDPEGRPISILGISRDITARKSAEQALRESEDRYRKLVEISPDAILVHQEGRIVYINPAGLELLGAAHADQVVGKPVLDYIHTDSLEKVRTNIGKDLKGERTPAEEIRMLRLDGETVTVEGQGVQALYQGKPAIQVAIRDITERKRAELALRESEDRLRTIMQSVQTGIVIIDAGTHTILDANRKALAMIGGKKADVIGSVCHRFICPCEQGECPITDLGQGADASERVLITMSGMRIPVLKTVIPATIAGRNVLVESVMDISELKSREDRIRILAGLLDLMPASVTVHDTEGRFLYANEKSFEYHGYSPEEFSKINLHELDVPESEHLIEERIRLLKETGHVSFEVQHYRKDGSVIPLLVNARITTWDGSPVILSIATDNTEREKTGQELVNAYQEYQNLLDQIQDVYYRSDKEGRLIRISQSLTDLLGYRDVSELLGKNIAEEFYLNPGDRTKLLEEISRKGKVTNYEVQLRRKDGTPVTISASSHLWYQPDGTIGGVEGSFRDITVQKQAEDALRESELLLREIFDNANDGVFLLERYPDGPGKYLLVNEKAIRMLGYSREELLTMSPRDIVPEDIARKVMPGVIQNLLRDGHATFESAHRRKDGSVYPIEVSTHTFHYQGKDVDLSIVRDITERKRSERIIQETNKKINLLSSITRHDVINQVSILKGYAKIALAKKPDPVVADFLAKIDTAGSTIARQIEFAREYQELGIQAPGWQRIRDIVAQQQTKEGISLSCSCDAEVFADPMLERVFFNLIDNAVRHGETVTAIWVSCQQDPDGLLIVVGDDGVGVPPGLKEKIFEKGYGKHTGFGLFLAREILAITGIIILETGSQGKGARFEIIVPKGMYRLVS